MTAQPGHVIEQTLRDRSELDRIRPTNDSSASAIGPFTVICPRCGGGLAPSEKDVLSCAADGQAFRRVGSVWKFLLPEQEAKFRPFLEDYQAIRLAEGRASTNPEYYRSLPERDLTGHFSVDWRIRSRSYNALLRAVVEPLEKQSREPLKIVDLGAGNCWLSNRLAERGHHVAAIDLLDNDFDGLGCRKYYESEFTAIQAEFERLPFAAGQFDLVIFNGSIHYATSYDRTLKEARRMMDPGGRLVIMDSPVYQDEQSGIQMIREREAQFERAYGFASDQLPSEGFLTFRRVRELELNLGLTWHFERIWYGPRWALRPLKARLLGRREPAQFILIVGELRKDASEASEPLSRRAARKLGRMAVGARYRLTQRHRHRQVILERVAGYPILVLPDVFNPALFRTGEFMAEFLNTKFISTGSTVLDMGTGSGIGAIAAARWIERVVAVDINPEAVRCARINALLNGLDDRVEIRESDLFDAVDEERFDIVIFNPPYFRGEPIDSYDHAWRSNDTVERFAASLADHLTDQGVAYVVLSSDGDSESFLRTFRRNNLVIDVVEQRELVNETLTIYGLHVDRG